jgi:hypothetical protein
LGLEQLQAAFYTEAVRRGALSGELLQFATIVGGHERAHVAFLQRALGRAGRSAPKFHFGDATSDPERLGAAAHALENIGVAAYNGQGANLTAAAMSHAAEIVSVEGRHAGWIGALVGDPPAPRAADPSVGNVSVRPASSPTNLVYSQYASAAGSVVLLAVDVVEVAGPEVDEGVV